MNDHQTLSQTVILPKNLKVEKLLEEASQISQTFLDNHYSKELLKDYQEWRENNHCKNYKFFNQTKYSPFKNQNDYYYNRYKRCVHQQIANLIENHSEKQKSFQFIQENTNGKITSEDKERLRNKLFKQDEFINIHQHKIVLKEIENYYKKHGKQPEEYVQTNQPRKHPLKLPLSPDDNHIHELKTNGENIEITLKTPDCETPETYHDYSKTTLTTTIPNHLEKLLNQGEICKPTLRYSNGQLLLDIPVKLNTTNQETKENRILACDLGVKTQVTSTILEKQNNEIKQVSQPDFHDHSCKRKLQRLIEERTSTPNNTPQYKNLREKEKNLRKQVQHDIANHLINRALINNCETIALENLSDLQAPKGLAKTSRHISHWARGGLLDKIEYKANLVGLKVNTVPPWKTSQYCSQCGEQGVTIKSSNVHKQLDSGGWFSCPHCGYNADRDYNASLNVGRVHYDPEDRIAQCKTVEYTSTGYPNAGFPSKASEVNGVRLTSVQPSHDSQGNPKKGLNRAKGCKTLVSVKNPDPSNSSITPIQRVIH